MNVRVAQQAGQAHVTVPVRSLDRGALGPQILAGAQKMFSPWRRHCQPQGLIAKSPTLKTKAGNRNNSKDAGHKDPTVGASQPLLQWLLPSLQSRVRGKVPLE